MLTLNTWQGLRMLRLGLALTFGLALLIGLLLAMGAAHTPEVALAQGPTIRYVDCASGNDSGNDCTNSSTPCATVQHAVDVADPGDEIRVAAGTYTESLTLDKPVSLMGDGADDTIIHALTGQRVMTITGSTITNSTVISGFTFTGGNPVADVGGGLLVITSTPTIHNNYFISNTLVMSYSGGGLYFQNSNGPLLSDNLIGGNSTITGCGGGLYFDNSANVTLTGNTISNNKASPFPSSGVGGSGGGVFFYNSPAATLSDNVILENRASWGGGLRFSNSPTATLTTNIISGNVGNHTGWGMKGYGGVYFYESNNATLIGNTISGNSAPNWCAGVCFVASDNAVLVGNAVISNTKVQLGFDGWGVGVYFHASKDARLVDNVIRNNTGQDIDLTGAANFLGGGLYIGPNCTVSLLSNTISSNGATRGGGLYAAPNSTVVLVSNWITGNAVYDFYGYDPVGYGGGLYLSDCFATLTNTVIADNQADTAGHGSGLYIDGSPARLLHTTIARNGGGDGSGVYITGTTSTVALTNTILVSHTVGITVTAGNTATLNGVLWYSNTINYGGMDTITVTNEYTGNPAFAADGYHLTTSSAAIDRGVDTGVKTDIDGHPRPLSGGADIGADEVGQMLIPLYIYPDTGSVGSRWDQVISASDQISITAIINPNSGPGGCPPDSAYETGINDLRNAGVTILGYVDTNYGERDAELYVKPDVDLYNQCFGIDGIFFDRVASSAIKISYYEDLYDYVKSKDNLYKVFLNPGTHIDEVYINLPAGDTAVIFEGYSWEIGLAMSQITMSAPTRLNALRCLCIACVL